MKNKIGNTPRITLNEYLANENRWKNREQILLKELTRLLLHIAPEVEPASDVVDVYWQVDNAVCGLLKERHLTPRALDAAKSPRKPNCGDRDCFECNPPRQ